jgi:extradiol dioxygenase family protein
MKGTFHLAFASGDLEKAKEFYGNFLNCKVGRSGPSWVDYDFLDTSSQSNTYLRKTKPTATFTTLHRVFH